MKLDGIADPRIPEAADVQDAAGIDSGPRDNHLRGHDADTGRQGAMGTDGGGAF